MTRAAATPTKGKTPENYGDSDANLARLGGPRRGCGGGAPAEIFWAKKLPKQAKSLFFGFYAFSGFCEFSLFGRDISGPEHGRPVRKRVCVAFPLERRTQNNAARRDGATRGDFSRTHKSGRSDRRTHMVIQRTWPPSERRRPGATSLATARGHAACRRASRPAGRARPCAAAAAPCRWRCTYASARSQQE